MTIGERLKIARKARGYTQDSLAEALGMSRGVITNIEYGRAEPQTLVIKAICEYPAYQPDLADDWKRQYGHRF